MSQSGFDRSSFGLQRLLYQAAVADSGIDGLKRLAGKKATVGFNKLEKVHHAFGDAICGVRAIAARVLLQIGVLF